MSEKILIVGLGNAGLRHAQNAADLGFDLVCYDVNPNSEPFMAIESRLEEAIEKKPLFAVVATPPADHVATALRLAEAGIPVLVEKPPALSLRDMQRLVLAFESRDLPLGVGYQMRQMLSLRLLRRRIATGEYGSVWKAEFELSTSDWIRPGTYQPDFLAECSHELDLAMMLFGPHASVLGRVEERMAVLSVRFYAGDCEALIRLDGAAEGYRRRIAVLGDVGAEEWTFDHAENDKAYRLQLAAFADACRGKAAYYCSGRDCVPTVALMEAVMKESSG